MPIDLAKAIGGGGGPELWVSGQTYAVGEQAISQTDFGVYIRNVAGAGTVDPASDSANWQPFGGRAIKSIQRGITTPSALQHSVIISTVNPQKSEVRLLTNTNWTSSGGTTSVLSYISLGSGGNSITLYGFQYYTTYTYYVPVSWEVTEYY